MKADERASSSHKLHPSQREEGSGHTATIELLPRQKLDVTNQIHALRSSEGLMVAVNDEW